ncbi:tetratricopeptide repeat protein [Flavobacterium zepuense]|uniref:Tetratricopeptide repeat protein n=1 Tax=Flavobacterium zepuense TaxID=2593302 RepID=A0A552UV58_9FLAO|nr:tetratricopeptide repeat protein [Flavobacterium zepuense]TRW22121.1 tetratricopeptide repeat protein [Flavobacterium zepuense]
MLKDAINKAFLFTLIIAGGLFCNVLSAAGLPPQKKCDSLINAGRRELDKNNHLKSLELTSQALKLAEKNHWQEQLFSAYSNIGTNYFAMVDYSEALNNYLVAYNIAIKEHWPEKEIQILNNIAVLYVKEKKLDRAHTYFKKAYDISKKHNDSARIAGYTLNMGLLMSDMGSLDKSRAYLNEALAFAKPDPSFSLVIQCAIAENEMLKKHWANAKQLATGLLNSIKNKEGDNTAVSLQLVLAKVYIQEKDYTKALAYTQSALQNNKDLDTKKTIYGILADIHTKSNSFLEALRCKDSIFSLQQKINEVKDGRAFENSRARFEIQEYQNQIALKEADMANDRKIFYSALFAVTSALLLIVYVFRNRAIQHKQKKLIAENNQQLLALELEKKKTEALLQEKMFREQQTQTQLEQERLKDEIEYKNRKLSSKALHMSGKDMLIEEFVGMLSGEPEVAKIPAVRNHIRHLKNTLKTDNEWASFLKHFEEVNQGFLNRLKARHTYLTANDTRFICYVYMNLSAKEMATMLNISLDACRKRKERVALKLGLNDATALYGYLSDI